MTPAQRANLGRLFAPRHAAFIGGRDAGVAIGEARRMGFAGAIWPVNPRREEITGIPCYRTVHDLPEAPDATFLAVPVVEAIETVRLLAQRGSGGVVCYTAGFGEMGGSGQDAEAALVEAAGDMALIGPNCYGVLSYVDKCALWPFAHGGTSIGEGAAIVTQSGMLSSDLTMAQRATPLTHMISIGNQAVITIEDLVTFFADHPAVRAIGIHIEGLRDVSAFAEAALMAAAAGKPVIALKSGSSAIGKALTTSHTGSMSGEDDLYTALFARCGIMRVASPAELLETLKFVCVAGAPKGRNLRGFTCSGGGATMLADHAERIGLAFPTPSDSASVRLRDILPPIATVSNPLDYTTPIWGQPEITREVFRTALAEGAEASVLVQDYPAPGLDDQRHFYQADGDAFADAALEAGIPAAICSTLPENLDAAARDHFVRRGIAPMQGINETLDAIAKAAKWAERNERILSKRPAPLHEPVGLTTPVALNEAEAKAILRDHDVPVPTGRSAAGNDLENVARSVGYPVALKMLGPKLQHKTEAGAVVLALQDAAELSAARNMMRTAVRRHNREALTDQFLIERMQAPPVAELVVAVRADPQFGLALTIGSGGILVEVMNDTVTLLLPASTSDIRQAIETLRGARLLKGFRNRAVVDLDRLADAIAQIATVAEKNRDRIGEIEINPLFVYENHVVAVDAVIHLFDRD